MEGNGKPEAQLRPSFSAALPIYILRRIYHRMCTFLISWMHNRARIDASMHLVRRTFSDARIAILFLRLLPIHLVFSSRVLVHPSLALISTQIHNLLFAFLSLSFYSLILSSLLFLFACLQYPHIFSVRFLFSSLAHFVIP